MEWKTEYWVCYKEQPTSPIGIHPTIEEATADAKLPANEWPGHPIQVLKVTVVGELSDKWEAKRECDCECGGCNCD